MKYVLWLLLLIPSTLLGIVCRFISPFACFFIYRSMREDKVKRLGKIRVTLPRDNLIPLLSGFNTHDNNTDEWWYGVYNVLFPIKRVREWTQADYDGSAFIRWFCRVMWLQRNSAYGFTYAWFSKPKSELTSSYTFGDENSGGFWVSFNNFQKSFQFEAHLPFGFGYFNSVNIGWKENTGQDRLLYAGRVLGIRHKK